MYVYKTCMIIQKFVDFFKWILELEFFELFYFFGLINRFCVELFCLFHNHGAKICKKTIIFVGYVHSDSRFERTSMLKQKKVICRYELLF